MKTLGRITKTLGGVAVIMRPNVRALSDKDVRDLASYFSQLPGKR